MLYYIIMFYYIIVCYISLHIRINIVNAGLFFDVLVYLTVNVEFNFVTKIEKCEKTDWKEVIQKSQFEKDC